MKKLFFLIPLLASSALFAQNTFPATGNVGIGTATPAYNLDISSGATTTLKIGSTVSTGNSDLIFKGSLNSWKISKAPSGTGGTSQTGILGFTCNTGIYGGDRPVMTLFLNGGYNPQVSINSTDPTLFGGVNLAVLGSIGAGSIYSGNSDISTSFGIGSGATLRLGIDGRIAARQMFIGAGTNQNSLGLGTTVILAVDGKIGAREMVISLTSSFPDYVFKPDYKLLPLAEVERYIKQNSRLPEMPSAEQVEKDGLEVAKTTALLVQKIEELTLHMIEMNKKIENLEKENKELKKRD